MEYGGKLAWRYHPSSSMAAMRKHRQLIRQNHLAYYRCNEAINAAATTPAVSERNTVSPRLTRRSNSANSSESHPPSGPITKKRSLETRADPEGSASATPAIFEMAITETGGWIVGKNTRRLCMLASRQILTRRDKLMWELVGVAVSALLPNRGPLAIDRRVGSKG